jgi:hypothetical protein
MSDAAPLSFVPVVISTAIFGGSVLVDWDTVPGADGYDVEVLDGEGDPLDPPPSIVWGEDGSSAVISGPAVATGVTLRVRVRSTSSYSAPVEIPVTILPAPAAPTLSAAADQMQATWDAVPGAQAYEVEVLDADGLPLHPQPPARVTGTSAAVDAGELRTGGAFGVRVRAHAGTSTSDWGAPGTVRVHRVPPPAITSALYRAGSIAFTWQAVPGATRYLVQVLDASGARLDPQPAVAGSNESASVSGVAIAGGARVQLQVGVEVTGQGSAWSDPLPMDLVDLAAPAPSVSLQRDGADVRWDAVDGATGYRVQLLDAQGAPSSDLAATVVEQPTARIPADVLRPGVGYAVQVTALAPGCEGPPSAATSFARVVLPAPQNVTATYHAAERRVALSWEAVETASGYFVRLLSEGGPAAGEVSTLDTSASLPLPGGGGAQVAQVRAARPDAEGDWASVDVTALDLAAPRGLTLVMDGDGIVAQWAAVEDATGYEVRVLDAEAEPWQPTPDVILEGNAAVISADGLDAGDYFEVRVRATAPGAVGPWSAPAFLRTDAPVAPSAVQAVYLSAARQVRVSWNPVAGADGYAVRIVDSAGRPVGAALQSPAPRATLDAAALSNGTVYGAHVSATVGGSEGPWSEPASFTTLDLPAPADLSATAADSVRATWTATDGADGYDLRVDDADGRRVTPAPRVTIEGTAARIDPAELGDHTYVELRVRATASGAAGPWSAPASVSLGASASQSASAQASSAQGPDGGGAETGSAGQANASSGTPADGNAGGADPAPRAPMMPSGQNGASAAVERGPGGDAAGAEGSASQVPELPAPAAIPGIEAVPESPADDASYGAPVSTTAQDAPEPDAPPSTSTVPDADEMEEAVG